MAAINSSVFREVKAFFTNNSIIKKISAFLSKLTGVKNSGAEPCPVLKMARVDSTKAPAPSAAEKTAGVCTKLSKVTVEPKSTGISSNNIPPAPPMPPTENVAKTATVLTTETKGAAMVDAKQVPAKNAATEGSKAANNIPSPPPMPPTPEPKSFSIPTPPPMPTQNLALSMPPPPPPMPSSASVVTQPWSTTSTTMTKSQDAMKMVKSLSDKGKETPDLLSALAGNPKFMAAKSEYGGEKYAAKPLTEEAADLLRLTRLDSQINPQAEPLKFTPVADIKDNQLFKRLKEKHAGEDVADSTPRVKLPPSKLEIANDKTISANKAFKADVDANQANLMAQIREVTAKIRAKNSNNS